MQKIIFGESVCVCVRTYQHSLSGICPGPTGGLSGLLTPRQFYPPPFSETWLELDPAKHVWAIYAKTSHRSSVGEIYENPAGGVFKPIINIHQCFLFDLIVGELAAKCESRDQFLENNTTKVIFFSCFLY